ncbi:hypothetical protein [Lentilitoribacter sp. Alg239-R112]|uniref:hypothetical protein n=1 Tax=Lentilitoribacter sp. Alg239-R112 TaxID=2305987 RepID=UPI0013A698C8|nr:hypothetical protein [Lentilitoribacter sp. Alg239-R112]
MSKMSYCFRDLENVSEDQRKSAILLALVARIDELREPNPAEAKKVSELFVPLFDTAPLDTKRQVASALSRCTFVPTRIAECICMQALEISAPFLSHSPAVTNPILCYVIAKKSEYHARIIAKRSNLHRSVVRSLEALDDHGVNLALQLRGYKSDNAMHIENAETRISMREPAQNASIQVGELELFTGDADLFPEKVLAVMARKLEAKAVAMREQLTSSATLNQKAIPVLQPKVQATTKSRFEIKIRTNEDTISQEANLTVEQTENTDIENQISDSEAISDKQFAAEEHLRQTLRDLATGDITPEDAEILQTAHDNGQFADIDADEILIPINQNEIQHRRHVKLLSKHVYNNHVGYFTTALADAIGSSYSLAERIMSDMTGRQLSMTFNAIFMPKDMCIEALNKFFPHVSMMEGTEEGAETLLQNWHHAPSQEKLITWLRADKLTSKTVVAELSMTDADIDYSSIDISDLPYAKPVADNADIISKWNDEDLEDDWLEAINN